MLELPDQEEFAEECHPTRQQLEQWQAIPPEKSAGGSKRKLAEGESAQLSAKSAKHRKTNHIENMIRSIVCNTCNKPVGSSEEWLIHIHQSATKEGSKEKHNLMCLRCGEVFQSFKLFRCHILSTGHVTPDETTTTGRGDNMSGYNGEEEVDNGGEEVDNGEEDRMEHDDEREEGGSSNVEHKEEGCRVFQRESSIFGRMQAIPGPQDGTSLRQFLERENQGLLAKLGI